MTKDTSLMNDSSPRCSAASKLVIGVDVGDKKSYFCVLNAEGQIAVEGKLTTSPESLRKHFAGLAACTVALEAGTHSRWIAELLKECGHRVLVANPYKIRLITQSDNKSDRVDARMLARLARADEQLLSPIQHRSAQAQAHLSLIRARDIVVRTRTSLINSVRGLIKPTGQRLPLCSTKCFARRAQSQIPESLLPALKPMLLQIESLTLTIRAYNNEVQRICAVEHGETQLLQQVNGVGPLTALAYVLTIDNPVRFAKSRNAGCYFGLRPKKRESGQRSPQLGICKAGDELVRRLLVQSAQYILGRFGADCDLRRWGLRIAGRGDKNAKKRAITAVARKLAVLLHHLWVTGEVYEPFKKSQAQQQKKANIPPIPREEPAAKEKSLSEEQMPTPLLAG